MGRAVYLKGLWEECGGSNGREGERTGRVEPQQVLERGAYISASVGGITIVYSVAVFFS
jgi:hypothetical protein